MKNAPSDTQDKFIIRMPNGLRDRIKKKADDNNRSMNAEIVQVLEGEYPLPKEGAVDAVTAELMNYITSKVPRDTFVDDFEIRIRQLVEQHVSKDSTGRK